ncbi:M4 family metallopeptidase [Nocardioides bruguierae]|uniref:M4 family metallopeptidase n=1 Tax=Nocardioides bruguierae TaxID=2945102 RepID=UPI00202097DC|nr:M4 family metallopeptidase [Nocardioides bruguierae]MCL8027083.1 M4 family metallopeptidase [Nocardioides bruguierae]
MQHHHDRPHARLGLAAAAVLALGAVAASTVPGTAQAAGSGTDAADRPGSGQVSGQVSADRAADVVSQVLEHRRVAKVSRGTAFEVSDTVLDPDGSAHVRMTRTYRGLPVLGGDVVAHESAQGAWAGLSRTLGSKVTVATTPNVARAAARSTAAAPSKDVRGIDGLEAQGPTRLVVDALAGAPTLAWEVTTVGTQADGTPSRLLTYVDADTGQVLRREETIRTIDGEGETLYGGTVPLDVTATASGYEMRDATRGGSYTTDMDGATDSYACQLLGMRCDDGTIVTSPTTSFGDGTNADPDTAAADAQYGTDVTWDYYLEVHGREGIFGDGSGSFNRVHYGSNYVNAFWDGEKMTYGDGDGSSYGPLVSLDVAGHEMSHGVTEHTANLTYSGEPGGLNEATSDIFGTMVEFYANNTEDAGDYLIGEEFDLASGQGLRRMDDPASDGSSQSCWSSSTANVDVHYSSGVGNHFFYLLAEGSGAKVIGGVQHDSPTCDGSTVTGIGRDAAADIWFRALTVYMTSGTDYSGARDATLAAAADLYGAGSTEETAVAAAWDAVDVA